MLSRLLPKPSHFRLLTLISTKPPAQAPRFHLLPRFFSSSNNGSNNNKNGGSRDQPTSNVWKLSRESDENFDQLFTQEADNLDGIAEDDSAPANDDSWVRSEDGDQGAAGDIFARVEKEIRGNKDDDGANEWVAATKFEPWSLVEEEKSDLFNIQEDAVEIGKPRDEIKEVDSESNEDARKLEKEEQELTAILKGPNRAFGDLIAASGITDDMLDSLIALKDLEGVEGLPPLSVLEDMRYEKNTRKSSRAEIERQKQEEVAKARVRQIDDKGRAYGTGRRKCSIARVWVQPGDGKFVVNDKEFDVYFPMLDSRAALLRPFSETKTLGLWDVKCTVKGGGTTGQVGAIQLGISRALQNWEPDFRPPLRASGFLTRDSRVVERKKPGKAKARKSFQWVKR
ncbi:28S ribosomal protein S9, mitochondrial [Cucurbita pepo subsp. pepo]|uniref:28S ribosomal protein S9, mitochondrial n=1 Tax=Cucurbita pepo subsp. pepo TaxID=3664 RepID=UPI000C9D2BE6|nr:28S ribosomal protein S9, mitochondrial [Cucurbita pepo subsp. pepo]